MNKLHVKYLLVGGGAAGAAAAEAIRARDAEGEVLFVTQESTRPYRRLPLAGRALLERLPRSALFIHRPNWYTEHHIELRTGRRAVNLDAARSAAVLDDGQEVSYDKLLIATGAAPRHLTVTGANLPGLHYLRTYEDLERLHNAVDKARAEGGRQVRRAGAPNSTGRGRVAVVGSGLLGVEVAASLTALGLEVELLLKHEHPWTRFAGEVTGKWAARVLDNNGVSVRPHGAPVRLEGDGRVQRVVLPTLEAMPCDFVVAAVGVVANRDLLRGTPITAEKAILTDPHARTNVENIWAAGDCAAVFDPLFNKYRVLDHFESAAALGALAGANMAGERRAYADVNHFGTELFGAPVHVWGESRHVHHRLLRGHPNGDSGSFVEFGLTGDDRISQVIAVNYPGDPGPLRELVRSRVNVAGREELVKDPGADLGGLV